jgi:putative transposase
MPNYRRAFVPGGCWVFTVNLLERRECLLVDHIASLREAVAATRRTYDFEIDAFVVLPIICMRSGRCRRATATSRRAGG